MVSSIHPMATKDEIKYYASLKQKKAREESGLFIAEGRKIVAEGLKSPCECARLFVKAGTPKSDPDVASLLEGWSYETLGELDFDRISDTENSQGVIGIFDYRKLIIQKPTADRLIALFDLADPRNMGTITRTCDWFGIKELLIGETCVDLFNPKTIRSTMGSIFHTRFILSKNLVDELGRYRETYKIVTADVAGTDYRAFDYSGKGIYVFSNEARGPSDGILAATDEVVTIPGGGKAESLNVASAASIIVARIFG
ncbi:MAG: RNA methyltransferase [Treponemataceae bacterium]